MVELVRSRLAGDLGAAANHIQRAAASARANNLVACELLALREAIHAIGDSPAIVSRVTQIARAAGPGLAELFHAEAVAIAAGDPDAFTAAAQSAERYGALGLAWELHAQASIAHCRGNLAEAFRSELAVERLGRQLPRQRSPLVDRLQPVLSERERAVAAAVSAGRSNRDVAEALFVSPATVKRHLERIYKRLGIANRKQLGALMRDRA